MESRVIPFKVCPRCHNNIWYVGKGRLWCKTCRDAWYEKNKEEMKAYQKQYYKDNKDEMRRKDKEWAKNNPDKMRVMAKRWRKNNPDKFRAQQNRRRKKEVINLNKRYVVERIRDGDPDIPISSITENDINKYREYLKTKRLCLKIQKELQLQD